MIEQKQKGFSLIELIVVTAIIMIMTALLLMITQQNRDQNDLSAAARVVAAQIREAQNNALTGRRLGDHRSCAFRLIVGSQQFEMEAEAYDPTFVNQKNCADATTIDIGVATPIEGGVLVKDPVTIRFDVPHARITNETFPSQLGAELVLVKGVDEYRVCLYPSGRVEERGFVESCQ